MPFEIIRNDITNMKTDAIVNTANPAPLIGFGVDAGIYQKAGKELLKDRRKIGKIEVGDAAITPAYNLDAKYVVHTVGPVWKGGDKGEEEKLKKCYENALMLALENGCESIAFPLISAGNHGFPKKTAFKIAVDAFNHFLMEYDMYIVLVVFGSEAFRFSEKLFTSVASYIDEKYIVQKTLEEYGVANKCDVRESELRQITECIDGMRIYNNSRMSAIYDGAEALTVCDDGVADDLKKMLEKTDSGFSETLLMLIDKTGKKDSEIYKKANVDRKLFSKIKNNPEYKPSKQTALAFAIALELSLEDTKDFISRAGFAFSHSSKFDIIIEYFIKNKIYDMFVINETLFEFDQNLLGV